MNEPTFADLSKLRVFVEVADLLSFSRAARRLGVTQPTISRHIKALEILVGVPLFDHRKRNLALSDAGHDMLRLARRMLEVADEVQAQVLQIQGGLVGWVTLGASYFWQGHMTELLIRFRLQHPKVRLLARYCHSREIFRILLENQIGLGFVAVRPDDQRFETQVLASKKTRLMLVTPLEHPLSRVDKLEPRALENYPFVWYPAQDGPRMYYPEQVGIKPTYAMEVEDLNGIKRAVEAGIGVSILPEVDVRDTDVYKIETIPLAGFTTERRLMVVRSKTRHFSPSERAFVEFVSSHNANLI